ncbi:unnamed protein product [Rhizophagus irregularis]|nr:unnamed protein product [Rhizophagus irregularis]CAB5378168.1 unnamed protein product [Rhizophagus irregularis]
MKKCWDSNPENRPNLTEIADLADSFEESFTASKKTCHYEYEKQFRIAEKRRLYLYYDKQHPQAIYTSRLLNPYTKDIQKYDNNLNEFSDDIAVETLLLQDVENPKYKSNEFSDSIAVEDFLLQHVTQL